MGKVQPNGFFFLFGQETAGSACRSACIYCNGGEAYEIPQYGKPVLHESGGVCRDRAAASGDGVSAALDSAIGLRRSSKRRTSRMYFFWKFWNRRPAQPEPPAQPEIAAASEAPTEQETEAEPVDPAACVFCGRGGRDRHRRRLQLSAGQAGAADPSVRTVAFG